MGLGLLLLGVGLLVEQLILISLVKLQTTHSHQINHISLIRSTTSAYVTKLLNYIALLVSRHEATPQYCLYQGTKLPHSIACIKAKGGQLLYLFITNRIGADPLYYSGRTNSLT